MRATALPDLIFGELAEAGGDVGVKRLHFAGGVVEEVSGDDVVGHGLMIAAAVEMVDCWA